MKFFWLFLLFLIPCLSFSQDLHFIKFSDKSDVEFYYENPTAMLSEKALERRDKYNISLDFTDIPVDSTYINEVKSLGIEPIGISKWFNGFFAWLLEEEIQELENLSFIANIFSFVNHPNATGKPQKIKKFEIENSTLKTTFNTNFTYTNTQIEQLNLQVLFEEGFTGEGITIAVIDNGFYGVNTDEGFAYIRDNNQIKGGYNFVNNNEDIYTEGTHGTMVLSTIGGYLEEEFIGTAIDADFYLFTTENNAYEMPDEEVNWIMAAEKADSLGVDIINTSLGYYEFDDPRYDYTYQDMDGETTYISRAAQMASEKGILAVISAGNAGNQDWHYISAPSDAAGVFSIGAVDFENNPASFTSFGPTADGRIKPDVSALGVQAAVLVDNAINFANGTSFSSPIMAGAMACLLQAFPEKPLEELKQKVRKSADLFENPTDQLGHGIPDFSKIYDDLLSVDSPILFPEIKVYPNPTADFLYLQTEENIKNIQLFSFEGKIIKNYTSTTSLDLKNLPTGKYILKIQLENGKVGQQQIIKK